MVAGIWPLTSVRERRIYDQRAACAGSRGLHGAHERGPEQRAEAEGVAIAREMMERVRTIVAGVQLSAPLGAAIQVAEAIASRGKSYTNQMATDLIEIDPAQPGMRAIERAAAVVRRGGVVAIPTDALYVLVCDPLNLHAVGRIFAAKGRKEERALPLLVSDVVMAEELTKEVSGALLSAGAALLAGTSDHHRPGILAGAA